MFGSSQIYFHGGLDQCEAAVRKKGKLPGNFAAPGRHTVSACISPG